MADGGTQGRILTAAFDLLARRGIGALTLDGVALHAGLSKGGILYYFKGKDELTEAMLRSAVAACMAKPEDGRVDFTHARIAVEPWRSLVRTVMAAASMCPQVLAGSDVLFADLSRGFVGRKAGMSARQSMAIIIGTAFLDEFGLNAQAKGEPRCPEGHGG